MSRIAFTLVLIASVTVARAGDFSNVRSGMLLGVYASPAKGGMQVQSTIPGYSAQGRLFPGDVLMRATSDGWQLYNLRSTYEMENAKMAIGPNREAALEIWRPSVGMIYAWVEFTPIAAPAAAYSVNGTRMQRSTGQSKARFRMESEKPGARQMFQRRSSSAPQSSASQGSSATGRNPHNRRTAESLFRR